MPLFSFDVSVGADSFRTLLRVLAGREDFARVNAHYTRRAHVPELADAARKRCCLWCWKTRGAVVMDSEWHALLDCPQTRSARARFYLTSFVDAHASWAPGASTVEDLAKLVLCARECRALRDGLCKLAVDVVAARRRGFRTLAPPVRPPAN